MKWIEHKRQRYTKKTDSRPGNATLLSGKRVHTSILFIYRLFYCRANNISQSRCDDCNCRLCFPFPFFSILNRRFCDDVYQRLQRFHTMARTETSKNDKCKGNTSYGRGQLAFPILFLKKKSQLYLYIQHRLLCNAVIFTFMIVHFSLSRSQNPKN